jgi:hypothetical protein
LSFNPSPQQLLDKLLRRAGATETEDPTEAEVEVLFVDRREDMI